MKIINWIKTHKLVVALLLVIAYLGMPHSFLQYPHMLMSKNMMYSDTDAVSISGYGASPATFSTRDYYSPAQVAPIMEMSARKVITQSNVSLLVKDVRETVDKITAETTNRKGYVVNTSVNFPEGGANAYVTVRVPSSELNSLLDQLRKLSVRVVSENISGNDVTDEYVDIQARLDTLNKTKVIYETMMSKAVNVDEILRVQQSLFSVQDQIDSYQGQLKYIDATSSSTLISMSLSTDEYSLPYAPQNPWRPEAIFKNAVRSLVEFFRFIGTAVIWIAVYSVIWIPVLVVLWWWKKRRNR